jgi:transketolase
VRNAFIKKITEMAREDSSIYLLTGDLGFSVVEEFKKEFPDRFLNVGVAEQAMIGIAAGLALSGKTVFVYSIATFATMRAYEQIRNDLCYHNLKVRIVGVGSGLSYSNYGLTHNSLSDIAIMRSIPNMTVVATGDPVEVEKVMEDSKDISGPIYIRLGKKGEPRLHPDNVNLKIGKGIILKDGKDIAIMTAGNMLETAKQVSEKLESLGISSRLISMHTIKPIDKELILDTANKIKYIFVIEEHHIIGGLGSAVSEVITESFLKEKVFVGHIGIDDIFPKTIGDQNYMRNLLGISSDKIMERIMNVIKNEK